MTKIIFMGTPDFSVPVLDGLIEKGYEVLAVVTQPDRAVGRKKEIKMTPVKEAALKHGLKVLQPEKLSNSPELDEIISLGADLIVTAAFGQFLPEKLLNSIDKAVNVHASLLPKYRGGAPVHYSIINGDDKTGVTIMEMVKKMDAGDIISQVEVEITEEDNVGTMFQKLSLAGRDLLLETLPAYLSGDITPQVQDEDLVTYSPNITPEEEKIDWNKSARQIFNQIRGMYPWPVAHTYLNENRFKIYEAKVSDKSGKPGQIVERTKNSLVVGTGAGAIELLTVQPAGKPKMKINDFLNGVGRDLKEGDKFGQE
ncbi:methionyl-tRNA formyltransferase [Floricoccus penangensis]|uniref:Methionyl-tRNA formyltransferase n=1 Tax=Floricoccus penangensis TaxID=1859475 RepID=A0A9Q5JFU7_9LACT|nr:methionyl-tRNA formyltransferase [Floricoccus penangensis]OFI46221.1 methionyl-tRNA formyltransferase [Floricoccus penangensis]URZ86939.1 methionyl-tRNA formyltransferase [Floricoccus penangensis]